MAKHSPRILDLAKRGAAAQVRDLLHEARMLLELFPDLRDSFDKDELPLNFIMAEGSGALMGKTRRRKPMSAAARKAVSARMKKYWAARKRKNGKKA